MGRAAKQPEEARRARRGDGVGQAEMGIQDDGPVLRQAEEAGLIPLFPLWGIDTAELAADMIEGGLRASLTCVDPKQIDAAFAGAQFDRALLGISS